MILNMMLKIFYILELIEKENICINFTSSTWYSKNDIVNEFYKKSLYFDKKLNKWKTKFNPENYKSKNFSEEIVDAKTQKVVVKLGEKINFLTAKKLFNDGLKEIFVANNSLYGKYLHKDYDVKDDKFKIGTELNETIVQKFLENEINEISVSSTNSISKGPYLLQTIYNDKNETKNDAINEIYKVLRPGKPPTIGLLLKFLIFFSVQKYDLSDVGRVKMNSKT